MKSLCFSIFYGPEGEKVGNFQKEYAIQIKDKTFLVGDTPEIHILYVVAGNCLLRMKDGEFTLSRGEVFIINYHQQAQVNLGQDSLVAKISLEYFSACHLDGVSRANFLMVFSDSVREWYDKLKNQVEKLLLAYTNGGSGHIFSERSEYYALVYLLFQHFLEAEPIFEKSNRIGQLMEILQEKEDLSLQELASRMYLSPTVVSRLFQKVTGEKFSQYKKRIRLEKVKEELLKGNKSVTVIALEAGFTSFTVFNRTFKETFGETPSQYRRKFQKHPESNTDDTGNFLWVQRLLQENMDTSDRLNQVQRVEANIQQRVDWNPYRNRILTVGSAHLLLGANMQSQIEFLIQRLDIEYIRIWGLFSEQMLLGDGREDIFHFSNLDTVIDFCLDHKLKLHFDLSPRRDFSPASETREIYSRKLQKRYNWFRLLDEFLQHIHRRYTEEVASGWIFEFTFYLNDQPYSEDDLGNNIEVWKKSFALVKSILPTARVAGPGLICGNPKESERMVEEWIGCGCLPDIFTSINYPYYYEGSLDKEPIFVKPLKKVNDSNFLVGQVRAIHQLLLQMNFTGEYWVTDWGISFGNRNFIQDSCYRASAVVDSMLKAINEADVFNIFCASDLLSAYGDTGNVLCGSHGLLSQTGICKPTYYAYTFLQQLGKYKILQAKNCIITAEGQREYRILCYNNKELGPKYFLLPEDFHKPDMLDELFVDLQPMQMEIVLKGIPKRQGPYYIRQRILNEEQGGALKKWIRLGCTLNLAREDLELLERTSIPDGTLEKREILNGDLTLNFTMQPNELRLIVIA